MATNKAGRDFESMVELSFTHYHEHGQATCSMMPVPMRACGVDRYGNSLFKPTGKSPFDIYGFEHHSARMIGLELKATKDYEERLSIVMPESKGSGVQYHQLYSLYLLAKHGGHSGIIWCNGGKNMAIRNSAIINKFMTIETGLKAKRFDKGDKSFHVSEFTELEDIGVITSSGKPDITIDWLPFIRHG